MPKMNHKNVVRYFSSWIEAVQPDIKAVKKAVRAVEERKREGSLVKGPRIAR
jgi:hypothetical protein